MTSSKEVMIPSTASAITSSVSSSVMTNNPALLDSIYAKSDDAASTNDEAQASKEGSTTSSSSNSSGYIVTLGPKAEKARKPSFNLAHLGKSATMSMLPRFLAQMDAANCRLEAEKVSGILVSRHIDVEEVDDNVRAKNVEVKINTDDRDGEMRMEPYIEMNIGLGVLEEKRFATKRTVPDESDSSEGSSWVDNYNVEDSKGNKIATHEVTHEKEKARKNQNKRPKIEEL